MNELHFSCTRCTTCCRSSIPLGIAEALDYDAEFLLALVFSVETWNLGDFSRNSPGLPLSHEELLTALAFRKDKLAQDPSRDMVFQVGRLKATGDRVATFISVGACALGEREAGATRCAALGPEGGCSIYARRPLACRVYPLDPLFPEMLQNVPLRALPGRTGCDCSEAAPAFWRGGELVDPEAARVLAARQEAIREDSLFLPFWGLAAGNFPPLPGLSELLGAVKGNGKVDLPFAPALVYLAAAGRIDERRAEECLERQAALAARAVEQAMARKDKAERGRTAVLRNCVALMESLKGRIGEAAAGLSAITE